MSKRQIHLTKVDLQQLTDLLPVSVTHGVPGRRELEQLLAKAMVVQPEDIAPSVVTINSQVRLRYFGTGQERSLTLVLPHQADCDKGRISVLTPIGLAIVGHSTGASLEVSVPAGKRRITIEEVLYQPEAAGDHHLKGSTGQ